MHQPHPHIWQCLGQISSRFIRRFALQLFGFLNQRTHPVSLTLLVYPVLYAADDIFTAFGGDNAGGDGLTSGR